MASGGHHGGGHHSGGHHGGGHHSSGHHGGGGHSYGGGHYHGGGSGGDFLIEVLIYVGIFVIFGIYQLFSYFASAFNVINVLMMIASVIMFIVGIVKRGHVGAIYDLKSTAYAGSCTFALYDKNYSRGGYGTRDGVSWYNSDSFCLIFDERNSRKENMRLAHEEIKKWPFILKLPDFIWFVSEIVWFILNFTFYELVIPFAENAIMSDEAFAFIDELVFYLPALMMLLSATAFMVIALVRIKYARKLCIHVVNTNIANKAINNVEEEIEVIIDNLWYHDICPNCGGEALSRDTRCRSCGSSLKINNPDSVDKLKRHQIQSVQTVKK